MSILPSAFDLPAGRLLALDLGQARIGVAVCDEAGMLASPLDVVRRHATRAEDFAAIADLVRRERAVGVLVGMPGADAGEPGAEGAVEASGSQARWTRRYAGRLAGSLDVPVAFWDETLSSVDAAERLAEAGGRTGIDAAAAALILADFLDSSKEEGPLMHRALHLILRFMLFLVPLSALAVLGFVAVSFVSAQLNDVPEPAHVALLKPASEQPLDLQPATIEQRLTGLYLRTQQAAIDTPASTEDKRKIFTIDSGETALSVATRLEEEGFIKDATCSAAICATTAIDQKLAAGDVRDLACHDHGGDCRPAAAGAL